MRNYQIVINILVFVSLLSGNLLVAQDTIIIKDKSHKRLDSIQRKYLTWVDKKGKDFPFGIPVLAGTKNDGLLLGTALINLKQPVKHVDFTGVFLYGTKSKKINGIASLDYYIRPKNNFIKHIKIGTRFKSFTYLNINQPYKYYAVKPNVQVVLDSKKHKGFSHVVQFCSHLIYEQVPYAVPGLVYTKDNTLKKMYANTLSYQFIKEHHRFPLQASMQIQQSNYFIKLNIEANSFIKYGVKDYNTGLHLRFFSGTFLYRNSSLRPRLTSNYGYTITGSTGENEYLYDDSYFGRNIENGFTSNQINESNGNMKFLANMPNVFYQEGRTMNYLLAFNILADFPIHYVPIKLFADIGFTSDKLINTQDKLPYNNFYYDAGLAFSFLNRAIEFYLPFLVPKDIKEQNKIYRPKFGQRISFRLDLNRIAIHRHLRELTF